MVISLLAFCSMYVAVSGTFDEKGLFGHWKFDNGNGVAEEIEYGADHLFHGDIIDKGVVAWKFAGTWQIEGDQLKAVFTKSSLSRIPPGQTDTDVLVTVNENSFSIRTQRDQIHRYVRVK